MCSDNCWLLSLQILQEVVTSPGVMGADPGAAPLTLISHNGQDTGQLFNKMPDLGGGTTGAWEEDSGSMNESPEW